MYCSNTGFVAITVSSTYVKPNFFRAVGILWLFSPNIETKLGAIETATLFLFFKKNLIFDTSDFKIDGFGAMKLKSSVVKKA